MVENGPMSIKFLVLGGGVFWVLGGGGRSADFIFMGAGIFLMNGLFAGGFPPWWKTAPLKRPLKRSMTFKFCCWYQPLVCGLSFSF